MSKTRKIGRGSGLLFLALLVAIPAYSQSVRNGPAAESEIPLPLLPPRPSTSSSSSGVPPDLLGSEAALLPSSKPIIELDPAPLAPTDQGFPINLGTALRLSDARPLVVASAQASVWVAEAQLTRAKVLWVPHLNLGFDYIRHDGGGPDFNRGIMTAPSVNFFYGGGAFVQNVNYSDVFFEPLAARQVLNARHWDVQTAKNDVLLDVANTYFKVHRERGSYAGALYCVRRGRDLVDRIDRLSTDLVPKVESARVRNIVADLEQEAVSARQNWRVDSARLTQILRLDPRAVLVPLEPDHLQVTIIDPARSLDELMPVAISNRPELAAQKALVKAAEARIRREKNRPILPTLRLNGFQTPYEQIQAGIFGLGPNNSLDQWTGRFDFSVQPLWQLESLGIGNLALIKEQRGEQSKAIIELFEQQDRVVADVTRALAKLQSAAVRVQQADRALRTAIVTFEGNFEGLQQTSRFGDVLQLVNRPQEVVFALQLQKEAFDEYFSTVAEYNSAQFELFHALGYPARELALLRPPGETVPVDTTRPGYLPPVGNGPPPASR